MGEKLVQTDTAGIKISPPLLYFGFAFLGIGVDFLFPAPIGLPSYAIYVGIVIVLLSLGFIGYIARLFRKAGTSPNPGKTTNNIVDYGP